MFNKSKSKICEEFKNNMLEETFLNWRNVSLSTDQKPLSNILNNIVKKEKNI